jgi:hypothetical protein
MACSISCSISLIFIIGMIYFYNATTKSKIVKYYKKTMSKALQDRYDRIANERRMISYYGYGIGLILSLVIIFYNMKLTRRNMNNMSLICVVLSTSFLTNYFYYMLSPKTDWMLNHVNNKEQTRAWLLMYRDMQYNYHCGLVLGIIATGVLAFAFRS